MKTKFILMIATVIAITIFLPQKSNGQQSWLLTGNNNANINSRLGTLNNFPLRFVADGNDWMRLETDGRVNINAQDLAASLTQARFAINSSPTQDPFRVMINGNTRFLVNEKGGVSIGTTTEGPAQGLFVNGNVGIGIAEPKANLHVFRGSSGTVTPNANSPLIVENSTNNYISLLAPSSSERGIIFGDNVRPVNGAILYNSSDNMLFQTQKVTRMILTATGNFGIGTASPTAALHIKSTGTRVAAFDGPTGMYVEVNETGAGRGYFGSVAGNNEDFEIGTNSMNSTGRLHFTIKAVPKMTINAAGNVGIGTSNQNHTLHLVYPTGSATHGITLENTAASALWWNIYGASTDELWLLNDNGVVGTFNGTSGVYSPISDRKFKKDISLMDNVLEKVMKLKPSHYHFNKQKQINDRKFIGMIAQEVRDVFPEIVFEHSGKNDGTEDFLTLAIHLLALLLLKLSRNNSKN